MKKKSIYRVVPVINMLLVLVVLMAGTAYFFDKRLFIGEMLVALAACVITIVRFFYLQRDIHHYFSEVSRSVEEIGSDSLSGFVMPLMIAKDSGEIVWYNDAFSREVLSGNDIFGETQTLILDEDALANLEQFRRADVWYENKLFTVFAYTTKVAGETQHVYYFDDNTRLWEVSEQLKNSRPCVLYVQIDSLDILLKNAAESEKAAVIGAIEKEIEALSDETGGYLQKISNDKYVLIVEERGLQKIMEGKFQILQNIRAMTFGERGNTSLSIGVGRGCATINEAKKQAEEALDMAIGRGGDQAAVKQQGEFEFYGGVGQATSKNSRVRTRVIAATLMKLIENSENVLLMGHSYSDMDCFGAAFGMWRAVTELGREAHIVVDPQKTMARPLIAHIAEMEKDLNKIILSPAQALAQMTKRTLLIILDTHRASFVESREVYERAHTVVIIDHHRKTVDFIDNALIFYHDPSTSSACEMVSELLQYMGPRLIGKLEAEALLSGIMLDTRNLVLRTSTRTFEASAYLRSRGADPVAVKRLFSDSMDLYRIRSSIVADASIVGDCAISVCESKGENARLASSQAADELLSISGVSASFVLYETREEIAVSARSLGQINVQLVMEQLGGGGHQTMAAAQLKGETMETAKIRLLEAIEKIHG